MRERPLNLMGIRPRLGPPERKAHLDFHINLCPLWALVIPISRSYSGAGGPRHPSLRPAQELPVAHDTSELIATVASLVGATAALIAAAARAVSLWKN